MQKVYEVVLPNPYNPTDPDEEIVLWIANLSNCKLTAVEWKGVKSLKEIEVMDNAKGIDLVIS